MSGHVYIVLTPTYTCQHRRHPFLLKTTRHCFPHRRALLIAGGRGREVKAKVLVFSLVMTPTAAGEMCGGCGCCLGLGSLPCQPHRAAELWFVTPCPVWDPSGVGWVRMEEGIAIAWWDASTQEWGEKGVVLLVGGNQTCILLWDHVWDLGWEMQCWSFPPISARPLGVAQRWACPALGWQ